MGQSLREIAQKLLDTDKKVQLIYAFNGVGKTRLSCEFKELVSTNSEGENNYEDQIRVLYYNAFTEDLFYWDNSPERKLKIQPNCFTDWVFSIQGQDRNIVTNFQRYTSNKLTPKFNDSYREITFSIKGGNEEKIDNIKISKGEESCLVWCVFYSLLNQIVDNLNIAEPAERDTSRFNDLQYIFIDDPVSSLDENHLIELAVNLGGLIKKENGLRFVVSTHNPLFFNVLFNETKNKVCYFLSKKRGWHL